MVKQFDELATQLYLNAGDVVLLFLLPAVKTGIEIGIHRLGDMSVSRLC